MAVPRWISKVAGKGAALAGRTYDYATPGSGTSTLTQAGRAIDDPNKVYTGGLSPSGLWNATRSGEQNFVSVAPSGGSSLPDVTEVLGANQLVPTDQMIPGGGIYDAAAAAREAYDPDKDMAKVNEVRGRVSGLMSIFEQAFQAAMQDIDTLALDRTGKLRENYTKQKETLGTNFSNASSGIDSQMRARNSFNSSFNAKEQGVAKDAYDSAFGELGRAQESDEANIGKFVSEQKASLGAARPTYDLGAYNTVSDTLAIEQDVDQAVKELTKTRAGLGTDSQYAARLNSIAPTQERGSDALKAQLVRLANTNASPETKRFIALSTINDAGEDEQSWIDFFERQMKATGSQSDSVNLAG